MKEQIKSKRFLVFTKDDGHEYDIFVSNDKDETEYKIHASKNGIWNDNVRGELFLTMVDSGNGVRFIRPAGKLVKEMDYSETEHMRILLNFRKSYDAHFDNILSPAYDIVEYKEPFTV